MSQGNVAPQHKPLNSRQKSFARELGIAMAEGKRDFTEVYIRVGYSPGKGARGNASRLAHDPQVQAIADEVAHEAVRLSGLHLAYLQAKGLQLLHANVFELHKAICEAVGIDGETGKVTFVPLSPEREAELIAATFPLSELKLGQIAVRLTDKRSVLETLLKTMPGALAAQRTELSGKDGRPIETRDVSDIAQMSDAELQRIAAGGA